MRLRPLQQAFAGYVLTDAQAIHSAVRPSSKADIDTLLGVYRHGYSARLVEVLGNDFPGLKALTGSEEFDRLARAYIAAHPSRGFSVRSLGEALPLFLRATPPYAQSPALGDMAEFELALAHAFDAADAEPVRPEQLAGVPAAAWPTLTFAFHPSLRRVPLGTSAPLAWSAQNAGGLPEEPIARRGEWLVWRQGLEVKFRPMDPDEADALVDATSGMDVAAICETLADHGREEEAPARAAGLIRAWFEAGLVIGLDHEGPFSS